MSSPSHAAQWLFTENSEHNRALNILNQNSESCVTGMEFGALQFAWRGQGQSADTLSQVMLDLRQAGIVSMEGAWVRLTDAGIALLFSETADPVESSTHGGQANVLSEYELRNRTLAVFSDEEKTLPADEIQRRWQAARHRAGDLRDGLDLLMRDGQVKRGRIRKTVFRVQDDGLAYIDGKAADQHLQHRSTPASREAIELPGASDTALVIMALHAFDKHRSDNTVTFATLDYYLDEYRLPAPLRYHAIELMHRLGYAEYGGDSSADGFVLTRAGQQLLSDSKARGGLQRTVTVELQAAREAYEKQQSEKVAQGVKL